MKLFIDIGNQRLKWVTCEQLSNLSEQSVQVQVEQQVCSSKPTAVRDFIHSIQPRRYLYAEIWISNVGSKKTERVIREFFSQEVGKDCFLAKAQKQFGQLINGYEITENLGVDRWLSAIAAIQRSDLPLLVVDAGTALTVDYIDQQGIYRGGMIVPGLNTMIHSLGNNTEIIKSETMKATSSAVRFDSTCTQQAVLNGAKIALVSILDKAIQFYSDKLSSSIGVVVTGGDGQLLMDLSKYRCLIFDPYLVLKGLFLTTMEKSE